MNENSREAIMAAARKAAQVRGYGGLNFRDLATAVGIKSASIHYYFPTKAELGAAVARRYREDSSAALEALLETTPDPVRCLREYPGQFRQSLVNENRLCLGSFMAAEHEDLPDAVKREVLAFADVHVAWLTRVLIAATGDRRRACEKRAAAIFAAVAGAQLVARSRSDLALYDQLIDSYRSSGLLGT